MNIKPINNITRTLALSTVILSSTVYGQVSSQNLSGKDGYGPEDINTITTAVPFLLIAPDSRSSAMGDAGVAISADANSIHWNPSKLAFMDDDKDFGVSISYSPWLRQLVNDINLGYVSGYKKLDKNSAVGVSLRYFSLGNITFTDIAGNVTRDFKPNEFAIDATYSRKLSEKFSAGIAARFINSNLTGGVTTVGGETRPGRSIAVDLSGFYQGDRFDLGSIESSLNYGFNISNIGTKMAYTDNADQDFIPTNLRLGTAWNLYLDDFNKLTVAFDANKLLVPTLPEYALNNGSNVIGADGLPVVFSGKDPNVGTAVGIIQSFYDAPGLVVVDDDGNTVGVEEGSKFREELNEINLSLGLEYWYSDIFAVRGGYFHEHFTKGNRRFVSLGAGVQYQAFNLDLSYLLALSQNSPIANTIRFTLRFNFGKSSGGEASPEG